MLSDSHVETVAPQVQPRRGSMLLVLCLIYLSNYLDRQVVAVLLPQIKAEFAVSDALLGLLTGVAFAVFYVVAGIPIARLADRGSRVKLLAICTALWSGCTALCGLATSFAMLVAARIGVGVGEAGCSPAAHSLIADYFPLEKRASALAFYQAAVPLGSLIAMAGGGLIAESYGWRSAFMIVGLPGVLLAMLAWSSLAEPREAGRGDSRSPADDTPTFSRCVARLWASLSFRYMSVAAALESFAGFGLAVWLPTYLVRTYSAKLSDIGVVIGLMMGLLGLVGTLSVGVLTDRLGRTDRRWNCRLPATVMAGTCVAYAAAFTSTGYLQTLIFLGLPLLALGSSGGPINAAVQSVVPTRMRATAAALFLFILNIIGYGLGPTYVGFMSDRLAPAHGIDSLRLALLSAGGAYALSALLYFLGSRHLIDDIARAEIR